MGLLLNSEKSNEEIQDGWNESLLCMDAHLQTLCTTPLTPLASRREHTSSQTFYCSYPQFMRLTFTLKHLRTAYFLLKYSLLGASLDMWQFLA
jgi:hypothetical protein